MRLATIRTTSGNRAVRIDSDHAVETGQEDVGALLREADWAEVAAGASGRAYPLSGIQYAPLIPRPGKIICVGINYRAHIEEMGREVPTHPTLFAKYAEALIGAQDDIILPAASTAMDWEAELAVVVGRRARNVDERGATAAIAGYTIINDVSARDWQYRTMQWLQGKTFESTCPLGPHLVTADEAGTGLELRCLVDGETVQSANTSDMVFGPAATVSYASQILTLNPGDVIALGTPGGVGHARKPPRYLQDGTVLTTSVSGLGECVNVARRAVP
ncbi:MAG: fumarylacetoacetate hydrolase family protein [Acidimicrobiales bacterium]